jgi:large subunit ribosomal protein L25
MKEIELRASRREVFGKHVRALRRRGILPARVYGPHTAPLPVQLDSQTFSKVWAKAGSLSLIDLDVDGDHSTVLIREVQRDPTTGVPLHADLFAVAMTERLKADVPLVFTGEAPAVGQGGVLLRGLDTVEIEALPRDLPHQIEVDLTPLEQIDSGIHVRDLAVPSGVAVLTPGDELVVKIAAPRIEVEEIVAPPPPPPPAEAAPGVAESEEELEKSG